jgi:hypothetical protein
MHFWPYTSSNHHPCTDYTSGRWLSCQEMDCINGVAAVCLWQNHFPLVGHCMMHELLYWHLCEWQFLSQSMHSDTFLGNYFWFKSPLNHPLWSKGVLRHYPLLSMFLKALIIFIHTWHGKNSCISSRLWLYQRCSIQSNARDVHQFCPCPAKYGMT